MVYDCRTLAAEVGIYGNSQDEAIYPVYAIDAGGKPLDASAARYELRFAPGELPRGTPGSVLMTMGSDQCSPSSSERAKRISLRSRV